MEIRNDGYIFVKKGFDRDEKELRLNETLFHNANGYLGVRGNFEEGYPEGTETVRGQYINGFYNNYKIGQEEWHIGFIKEKHTMVNVFDTQTMKLELDGEEVSLFEGKVLDFSRTLDMKKGITRRWFCWESPKGKQIEVEITRLASFVMLPLFLIDYRIRPLNFSGQAKIISLQSGNVSNYFNEKDSRVAGEKRHHIETVKCEAVEEYTGVVRSRTTVSGLEAVCVVRHVCPESWKQTLSVGTDSVENILEFSVDRGEWAEVQKYTVICDSLRYPHIEQEALKLMEEAAAQGVSQWFQKQEKYLDHFWQQSFMEIQGDLVLNVSLHYNLYGLLQSASKDSFGNIGAKGLSGEGYEGHYFWDTEMYMLPFFSLTQPGMAKTLLNYRYHILEPARKHARAMGHKKGVLFPWRTINGSECSYFYPSGGAQYHIIGDIAYGIVQYYLITGDWDYMAEQGAEILMETARVWYDLGHFYQGSFHIHCVTGPDEYTCVVNNNYYTNLTAKHNLLWAARIYRDMEKNGSLEKLQKKIGITKEEILGFEQAAEAMYLLYDEKLDINPQDDSFLTKKVWDLSQVTNHEKPLMHDHFLFHIYRHQVCKQADTVLAHFLFEDEQKLSTMKHSFDYYEKITTHDSSLSRCIFGIMSSKLGMKEKAYEYFNFSSKMDILNSQHNTEDGIHTANMGGCYMGIVYGFLGLRVKESGFYFTPSIPEQWDGYCLRLCLKGSLLEITVDKKQCHLKLLKGEPITVYVYEKMYDIQDENRIDLE